MSAAPDHLDDLTLTIRGELLPISLWFAANGQGRKSIDFESAGDGMVRATFRDRTDFDVARERFEVLEGDRRD